MYFKDYVQKIENVFSDTKKIEKLSEDPLEKNLQNCRRSVKSFKKYVNSKTFAKLLNTRKYVSQDFYSRSPESTNNQTCF